MRIRRLAIPVIALGLVPVFAAAPAARSGAPTCLGHAVTVTGSSSNDTIDLGDGSHGPGPHVVATFGGRDTVIGSDGDDVVCLGGGRDRFEGRAGNDLVSGGSGKDQLFGEGGDDRLIGGSKADLLDGGEGDDALIGKSGHDRLIGGPGNDDIRGGSGNDHADGGPGNDIMRGGTGDDRLNGGDSSSVDSGVDDIRGNAGFDQLWSDWSRHDNDFDSTLRGGKDYDYCEEGAVRKGCERTHYQAGSWSAAREEWRDLITEAFGRWGLDEEACDDVNGEARCVGPQIEQALDVLVCESWGFPFAVSSSGTGGLFQHRPQYFKGRIASAALETWVEYDWPDSPSLFDPELNAMLAGWLVWRSREVQLGHIYYSGYWNPYPSEGYYSSNWAKGPDPWGHWTCGQHTDHWYPAWVHPSFDGV